MLAIKEKLRICFMGSPQFAVPVMEAVAAEEGLIGVVTQPDRPRGRGQRPAPPPVKVRAMELGLPILQPERVRDPAFIDQLASWRPDLIVVAAFGQILPPEILRMPRFGCVNCHPSLLPRYRGAAPIQWAVIKGETVTGVTTYLMDEGMDTGPILLQQEVAIGEEQTAAELTHRLGELGARLMVETIHGIKDGTLRPIPQDETAASYAPMLKKTDGLINWQEEAHRIRDLIRGMLPWPVAYTTWEGKQMKVFRGTIGTGKGAPGELISLTHGIEVACGKGSIIIEELQLAGGKRLIWDAFLRGHRLTTGERLGL